MLVVGWSAVLVVGAPLPAQGVLHVLSEAPQTLALGVIEVRVLTGLDRDSIEMREVSPMGGLLTREQRDEVIAVAG